MKFATIALLGILCLGAFASLNAQTPGTSQVVLAYSNESVPPSAVLPGFDGLCLIYYTMVGDFDLKALFAPGVDGNPVVDRAHAYFIWVSDYKAQALTQNEEFTIFLIPEGTGTIYYTERPDLRDWTNRSTWGDPVAQFVRRAGTFVSRDGGYSGTLSNTAELVSSNLFNLHGNTFNLRLLIPFGMTCFETAAGDYEAGTCFTIGGK
jgi:hypothetical protein